ncbi:AAA family ATPase [Eudoraea chungangensis]|uniref:AAA family ATPase n=1 Tax=Eudoraea chungangensis TaxID=1481905 RepID=UPI0023ECDE74|nr:ATP-binding protein [Eudoraea chungangensis]
MNKDILKRLFKSIDGNPEDDIVKVAYDIIKDEEEKGHHVLSKQLRAILDENVQVSKKLGKELKDIFSGSNARGNAKDFPLAVQIPREELRHHMVLSKEIESKFQRIEKEFVARARLAKHGLKPKQKILFFGPPGCGKSMGAERLAWNIGLPFYKVRFEAVISSYLGESLVNLKKLFDSIQSFPCVLLLDEFDIIAKSRNYGQDVGEMHRLVNMVLFLLEEYNAPGLLVATTNLETSLDKAVFRRFDEVIEITKPGGKEIESLLKMTFSSTALANDIDFSKYAEKLQGFSSAEIVKIAENLIKSTVIDGVKRIESSDFDRIINETIRFHENK